MSMCMGANATFNAMDRAPEAFEGIRSMIAVAPLKGRTTIERNCGHMQIPVEEGVGAFDGIYNGITGMHVSDHDIIPKAASAVLPIFYLQVRDDMNSRWTDVQEMFDRTPGDDKKIEFVEGTPWRFHGYTYFSEHSQEMVDWFDSHS